MEDNSLVPCAGCAQHISPQAESCPHCGQTYKVYRGFEWKSNAAVGRWPVVHIAFGREKRTGKRLVARGVIAIGQYAMGVITVAQFGVGLLFGFGQFMAGYTVISQFGVAVRFAAAQFAAAETAIGQFAFGKYVLAQVGYGEFVWSVARKDPEAIEYFEQFWMIVKQFFGA